MLTMIKFGVALFCSYFLGVPVKPQQNPAAVTWADSVYKKLTPEQRIAQLMVVRMSGIDPNTKQPVFYTSEVTALIKKYNIGGVCLFQGSPVAQANTINKIQALAQTPLMVCIDGEWGVGMRMTDSVAPLPKQMMLGAMQNAEIVYQYGKLVAAQCKRIGIQVNYAPVVDVNNNANNPVINDRSFGEDKYKVANYGVAYMKGMQDHGVMACAKHFPGHGDVAVDSHYDLPVINKSFAELDSLELYPFKKIFDAGVGSVMIAHLYIPAIDKTKNRATSLSPENINVLLRKKLNYDGLTFTDALEMQGVQKFFKGGDASVQSLIAGNDMLCLPVDVPGSIAKIKLAIQKKQLSWKDIEYHCKKVLAAKYHYGLAELKPIDTKNITADLNAGINDMRRLVAENAITLVANKNTSFFPLQQRNATGKNELAYLLIGSKKDNAMSGRMRTDYNADVFYFDYADKDFTALKTSLSKYKKIVVGIHNLSRSPAANFNLSSAAIQLVQTLQDENNSLVFLFGNAYAAKNWCNANNLVVCYEDESITQHTAADLLQGKINYKGVLPVTVCEQLPYGKGLSSNLAPKLIPRATTDLANFARLDSIANDAVAQGATPGCVIMLVKNGVIAYEKAYGKPGYADETSVNTEALYDLASLTKICATTLAVMKLHDEALLDIDQPIVRYLPAVQGTDKATILVKDLLRHQGGLVSFIPFYRETVDAAGVPLKELYQPLASDSFGVQVASHLYLKNNWRDTMYQRILASPLKQAGKYVYSDNDFILLQLIVERLTGMPLDVYVSKNFYTPMGLSSIGFQPLMRRGSLQIMPTEQEVIFRHQLLRGYVHDPGAAMFGGVAGHAGLFSDAYDVAAIMQMLLQNGNYNGRQYLQANTVALFTAYQSDISRRGYGFDKPEKDNATNAMPYPAALASPKTFGHTGFTGTAAWADPEKNLVFVFLSNRVNGDNKNLLGTLNVRAKLLDEAYRIL